jgi:hypothetical protein
VQCNVANGADAAEDLVGATHAVGRGGGFPAAKLRVWESGPPSAAAPDLHCKFAGCSRDTRRSSHSARHAFFTRGNATPSDAALAAETDDATASGGYDCWP